MKQKAARVIKGRELIVGVTGGVAAYKAAYLVSRLAQADAAVTVVMTRAAQRFIGSATFAALSGRTVYDEMFAQQEMPLGPHIELAQRAELLCIAPASADFLAKAAHGLADDLLSTLYLAFEGKVLMAPAMNSQMWDQPAVQRNVQQLRDDGVTMVGPESGWLSCRVRGAGRMAEPDQILQAITAALQT